MNAMSSYFEAEKSESLIFILLGAAATAVALYGAFTLKTDWWKGAAWPLILVALIQLVVGGTVYLRSDKQLADVLNRHAAAPQQLASAELQRMEAVNKNFVIYRYVEIALLAAGLLIAFSLREKQLWSGVGIALFIQSALMLLADYFAESRALVYTAFLKSLL